MSMVQASRPSDTDPRRLRELLSRAGNLASTHAVPSVIVGLAGCEGDLLVPELIEFIESALRMEDAIFRITRERAVLFVSDVDRPRAEDIVERLVDGFRQRFPSAQPLELNLSFFEVVPDRHAEISVKHVLPELFKPKQAPQD